jgi:hypothetical protein
MEGISPLLQDLGAIKASHAEAFDPSRQADARQRLIAAIGERSRTLDDQIHRFRDFRRAKEGFELVSLAQGMRDKSISQGLGPDIAQHYSAREFEQDARSFQHKIESALQDEAAAFSGAQDAYLAPRRWVRLSAALSGFLLLILGFIGWKFLLRGRGSKAFAAGAVLGRNYRIVRPLGRGSLFEAADLALHRKVAIKRLREGLIPDRKEFERFLGEARRAATLKHPNIAEIYAIFEEAGQAFLVFEFVPGRSLSRRLEISRSLSLASSKDVLEQIAAALDYAHSRNVLHRNLKPSSILIDDRGAVKVMDFGAAPRWAASRSPYAAPEQSQSGAALRESDLFSLGVMLYEMLTGRLPREGQGLPKPAGLPPGLDEILRRALQSDPHDRYHSGREFASALRGVPA